MFLTQLGRKYGTDKANPTHTHLGKTYCDVYEKYFNDIRNEVKTFIEIGVLNGRSLLMWEEYFPNATIYGVDINPNVKQFENGRVKILIGDQNNPDFLKKLEDIGQYDILLDDGSHIIRHQINSFNTLFKNCKYYYVIEDLRCSYEENINKHDIRKIWPGQAFNDPTDDLKNYRKDMNDFLLSHIKQMDFHQTKKLFSIKFYPMIAIFECIK